MRSALITAAAVLLLASNVDAFAITCSSLGGHVNGKRVTATRTIKMQGSTMVLGGAYQGQKALARRLTCLKTKIGLLCARQFGPIDITIMTRGRQMVEVLTETASGIEIGNIAYQCDGKPKMK